MEYPEVDWFLEPAEAGTLLDLWSFGRAPLGPALQFRSSALIGLDSIAVWICDIQLLKPCENYQRISKCALGGCGRRMKRGTRRVSCYSLAEMSPSSVPHS